MRRLLLCALMLAFIACGDPVRRDESGPRRRDAGAADAQWTDAGNDEDAGDSPDAGDEPDGGEQPDAGTHQDGGEEADAGEEPDAGVNLDAGTTPDGGHPDGTGTVNGSVNGYGVTVRSTLVAHLDEVNPSAGLEIGLFDTEGFCTDAQNGVLRAQQASLAFLLYQADSQAKRIAPTSGQYTVVNFGTNPKANERTAWAIFVPPSSTCSSDPLFGSSGTVTLTSLDMARSGTEGAFDVTFGASRLTGSLGAPICRNVSRENDRTCE